MIRDDENQYKPVPKLQGTPEERTRQRELMKLMPDPAALKELTQIHTAIKLRHQANIKTFRSAKRLINPLTGVEQIVEDQEV